MLSERQVLILRAAVNRIIPPDDFPGGWEEGVGDYLFRQFEGDLKHLIDTYGRGLDALDAEAQMMHGKTFDQLDPTAQDEVLTRIEGGETQTEWPVSAASFFGLLVDHCMEGYYSDPGNGGNRDGVAWKMIGFEVSA